MTNRYGVFEKCKNPDCNFKSDDMRNYDDEGYCRNCSEARSEMQKEGAKD